MIKKKYHEIAEKIVADMTLEEAASQIRYDSPEVARLGIPAYNWWNEGLHGLARAGTATVFPQAIALAAMFDSEMLQEIGDVVATEARAKYNESRKRGDRDLYKGITMWSPNINIFRDGRWGRGQETYGEDPYLTARLGVAFIKGLQGDGDYMKVAGCAKHFAVHSGPEALRHSFDAVSSQKDLEETYLPAFEAAVREADVAGIMGAYNRVNGQPACANDELMDKLKEWGFDGYFVSDFLALMDIHENHKVTKDVLETIALALGKGCDVNAGFVYRSVMEAYDKGMITEEEIRRAAVHAYTVRAALGMFSDDCEYDNINIDYIDTDESAELSYKASVNSTVLLKNNGILPLNIENDNISKIAVIGPTATSLEVLYGNYSGTSSRCITNLQGIRNNAKDYSIRVLYSEGCHLFENKVQNLAFDDDRISEALTLVEDSDVTILFVGLDPTIEGEQGDTGNAFAAGDKNTMYLPDSQRRMIKAVKETGKPVILVLNTGSAIDLSFEDENFDAIIQSWYSGQTGGQAIADIIFGKALPGGKLPVTFYKENQQPDMEDYSMKGRTYRFFGDKPLYPFGYGLSYSDFEYSNMAVTENNDGSVIVSFDLTNKGSYDADEICEIYISINPEEKISNGLNNTIENLSTRLDPSNQPFWSLAGFERITLLAGETKKVSVLISEKSFTCVLEDGQRVKLRGSYDIYVGGQQPDARTEELTGKKCLVNQITV
ncbi:MAG: glycoside hydrolase family 3 C-terminal domain-containing protein [Eubacterium sp.]|nr:glycoside hydrolase family 3 C-terminal domain-containing protein [Eubacterium sp.]